MKERKNIDRLYHEKFRDFEATPRDAVWKSISAKLQEKEKRKYVVRPLWSRVAGVAAIISLLLLIGDWILQPQSNPVVSNEEQTLENDNGIALPNEISIAATNTSEEGVTSEGTEEAVDGTNRAIVSGSIPTGKPAVSETSSISFSGIKKAISSFTGLESSVSMNTPTEKGKLSSTTPEGKSILDDLNNFSREEEISSSFHTKIEVRTHAAPIYYGNFGKGNFLDAQFDNNSSEGEVTYSYGINIAYAISEKLKIRSGINKVAMSYNTNDISYHSVMDPYAVSSINYRPSDNVVVRENPTGGKGEPMAATRKSTFGNLNTGLLNQKLGYLEVPLELEYTLINKKFEVNLVGGASTLFLDENMISVNSAGLSTDLGEANNLNNVSFSTNIGLGVDYNLTKQFKLNVEPMFKYQINTFSGTSGEYQPYYLGIYSGFSFEF